MAPPDRPERILESSTELFARKGLATTTVREIGDAAGVFAVSLYHRFNSKNARVAERMRGFVVDIQLRCDQVEMTAGGPEDVLRGLIRETLIVIELHPHPIYQNDRAYLRDNDLLQSADGPSRQVREHRMKAIAEGVNPGTFRKDVARRSSIDRHETSCGRRRIGRAARNTPPNSSRIVRPRLFLSGFRAPPTPAGHERLSLSGRYVSRPLSP